MTPYEFEISLRGYGLAKEREAQEYKIKFEQEHNDRLVQAYLLSRWVWAKKVNLDEYMNFKPKKRMTDEEMYSQVKALNAMFGGEVIAKK